MENLALYEQLLNLSSVKIEAVELAHNKITVSCKLTGKSAPCPTCCQLSSQPRQSYSRKLRDLNVSSREVYLVVKIRQFYCKTCKTCFTESLDFADSNKSHTHRQEDFMFAVGRKQSYTETAVILNIPPKTVERTILSICQKQVNTAERYANVRRLGIDEQSHRKGKKDYICVLTDLDKGLLIDILKSRKKEDLIAHFESLGSEFCAQITSVSCDYWRGYISVAQHCFPNADIVLDRFHVTNLLNICVDKFRKSLRKSDAGNINYRHIKWILYKQYHMLSDKELDNLHACFQDSPLLKEVYWKRDQFHHILDNNSVQSEAAQKIKEWTESMNEELKTVFQTFIKTLSTTTEYIANYVKNFLSNAVTEGLNNLIRSIRRVAFGMPNFEHLRWRALAISN